jgi:hypothetical protein
MSDREHEYVDEAWLNKQEKNDFEFTISSCEKRKWGEVHLPHEKIKQKLQKKVKKFLFENSLLFLDEGGIQLDIITQQAHGDSEESILRGICVALNYKVLDIKNDTKLGKYLYSNGHGHYSTDVYQRIHFCRITIVH